MSEKSNDEILQGLYDDTLVGNAPSVKELTEQGLAQGMDPEQLLYDALSNRDFPMVQGVVLMSGLMIVLLNFTIDVLYGCVDPRIRLSR